REFTDPRVRGLNPTSASRLPQSRLGQPISTPALLLPSVMELEVAQWLRRQLMERKVRGSASRLLLSMLEQSSGIPAILPPSVGKPARHRKGAAAERFMDQTPNQWRTC
ncbi:hypothetical protein T265_12562, partial [Opisthorchis viverrini]